MLLSTLAPLLSGLLIALVPPTSLHRSGATPPGARADPSTPAPGDCGGALFEEGAAAAGLVYSPRGRGGIGVGDADGDGWQDVVFSGSPVDGTRLFLNQRDGTFLDVTPTAFPADVPASWEAQFADLDGDGDEDLVLSRWYDSLGYDTGFWWLENDGGGHFEHGSSIPVDLARDLAEPGNLAAGDCDGDGDLDVVLLHSVGPGWYLENDGDGGFSDATAAFAAGLANPRKHWSGPFGDYDRDGDLDLHVAIDRDHDYHAQNQGDGRFLDVSVAVGVSNVGEDMGVATGDFDMDGDIDLYSTNVGYNVLYVNDGAGNFVDEAEERNAHAPTAQGEPDATSWGTVFADLDNDQDEDIVYVAGNFISGAWGRVLLNDGTGHFEPGTETCGLNTSLAGRALVAFDFDRDGDLDLLTSGYTLFAQLFVNQLDPVTGSGDANWLQVDLVGRASAPHGIGAWIEVEVGDRTLTRHVTSGASMNSGVPLRQHVGLGASTQADRVRVIWPDGTQQELLDVAAGQFLRIRQLTSRAR